MVPDPRYSPSKRAGGNTRGQVQQAFHREGSRRTGEPPRPTRDRRILDKREDIRIRRGSGLPDVYREDAVAVGRRKPNRRDADAGLEIDLFLVGQGKSATVCTMSGPAPVYYQGRALNLASFVVQGVRRRLVLLQMTSSARARISSSVLRCVPDRRFSLSLHDALLHRRLAEFAFLDSQFALRYFPAAERPSACGRCDWRSDSGSFGARGGRLFRRAARFL